jgi:hypothetical protein
MSKTELLGNIGYALALFNGVVHKCGATEKAADAEFEQFVDLVADEFSDDEWRSFYAENDRLWEILKDDHSTRNAYPVGLLQHALKLVEARR